MTAPLDIRPVINALPCDTYKCADRMWCIVRRTCKREADRTPEEAAKIAVKRIMSP